MNSYSAQGSILIKRLRNGDSLYLTLETNGKPLYQGIDPNTGVAKPDWSVAANQPIITPVANSVRGNTVSLSSHSWYYNSDSVPLVFNGATEGDWVTDSTGKFKMNVVTGALRIIANLASLSNIANDTLLYKAVATVAGVEYPIQKSTDIIIQNIGASSYIGFIIASTEQLTSQVTSATLNTNLKLAAEDVSNYHVKWYKDTVEWVAKAGQKTITVTRDDINGTQLILAEFYKTSSDSQPIFRAGIRIKDTLDDYQVICYISSTNKEVDTGAPVTVSAKIVNQRTNTVITPASPTWRMYIMQKSDWAVLATSNTNTITVTTEHTDRDGQENDVEVTGEAEWSD